MFVKQETVIIIRTFFLEKLHQLLYKIQLYLKGQKDFHIHS